MKHMMRNDVEILFISQYMWGGRPPLAHGATKSERLMRKLVSCPKDGAQTTVMPLCYVYDEICWISSRNVV